MTVASGNPPRSDLLAGRPSAAEWTRRVRRLLALGDTAAALVAYMVVLALRWRIGGMVPWFEVAFVAGLVAAWPAALAVAGAYQERVRGEGAEEFRAVIHGGLGLAAAVGLGAYATKLMVARSTVLAMLPLATFLTLLFRLHVRRWRHRQYAGGRHLRRLVVVGHHGAARDLVTRLRREPHHGFVVVAACLPNGPDDAAGIEGVPVLGDFADVAAVVRKVAAEAVAVLACPELDGLRLRRLAESIEEGDTSLLVAPALMDVAGPRISVRPIAGMPLLHVDHPTLSGRGWFVKGLFDRSVAFAGLLLLGLPMLVIAALVRVTSPGPALFRQVRVGRNGREFRIFKFRTMTRDAEERKVFVTVGEHVDSVLLKQRNDPRITPVGRFLRRYSLDELPQLLNVLRGEMSLVGPRPLVSQEVASYGPDLRRRLMFRPGMTGLWQVSGRSDVSWEERLRLDLRYVENWSLMFDLEILWKTGGAVLRADGAY